MTELPTLKQNTKNVFHKNDFFMMKDNNKSPFKEPLLERTRDSKPMVSKSKSHDGIGSYYTSFKGFLLSIYSKFVLDDTNSEFEKQVYLCLIF
jgi:hypothetical protein